VQPSKEKPADNVNVPVNDNTDIQFGTFDEVCSCNYLGTPGRSSRYLTQTNLVFRVEESCRGQIQPLLEKGRLRPLLSFQRRVTVQPADLEKQAMKTSQLRILQLKLLSQMLILPQLLQEVNGVLL
jgi:hypothetical protein